MTNQSPQREELEEKLAKIFDEYHGEFWNGNMLVEIADMLAQTQKDTITRVLELIGDDYKPSKIDNDKRWTREVPPSSTCYVSKAEALAANWEFEQLRTALTKELENLSHE